MLNLFLGFTATPAAGWNQYVTPPTPRKGTKDPVKQQQQIADKEQELQELAHTCPILAMLTSAAVLDASSASLLELSSPYSDVPIGAMLGMLLRQKCHEAERPICLYGFDIQKYMTIAAFEALRHQVATIPSGVPTYTIPFEFWRETPLADERHLVDPYRLLMPTAYRGILDLPAICRFLGIPCLSDEDLATSPIGQARLALELCKKTGILSAS
jgi:hypothetical protein